MTDIVNPTPESAPSPIPTNIPPEMTFKDAMQHLRLLWDLRGVLEGSPLYEQFKFTVNCLQSFIFKLDMKSQQEVKEEVKEEVEKSKAQ